MHRYLLFILIFSLHIPLSAQLSKGVGETVSIPDTKFKCLLPQYFEVQNTPPGVIHKVSGTFVILVKVPPDKKVNMEEGPSKSFFENPQYEIISLKEENASDRLKRKDGKLYFMKYKIQNFEFERYTLFIKDGEDQYLIIGNYPVKLKNQVHEEVEKIMASFVRQ